MAKKVEAPAQRAAAAKKSPAPASKQAPAAAKKSSNAVAKTAASSKAPAKATAKASPKAAPAPAKKAVAATKATNHKTAAPAKDVKAVKAAPAKKAAEPAKKAAVTAPAEPAAKAAPAAVKAVVKKAAPPAPPAPTMSPVRGETKDGIKYTKDFDAKFLTGQWKLLIEARESLTGQAVRLEDEANSLIDDEMGDVQFDDESGEGDTMVVERERDLFLSARARQDIEEIDAAIERLHSGTYGYSVVSMRPIPRERLEAIPWATELTEEKVGGIGRR